MFVAPNNDLLLSILCCQTLLYDGFSVSSGYSITRPFHYLCFSDTPIHTTTTRCVIFNKNNRQGRTR